MLLIKDTPKIGRRILEIKKTEKPPGLRDTTYTLTDRADRWLQSNITQNTIQQKTLLQIKKVTSNKKIFDSQEDKTILHLS